MAIFVKYLKLVFFCFAMRKGVLIFFVMLLVLASAAAADNVTLYFFNSNSCPHCAQEKIFLSKLIDKYPSLTVESYEISEPGTAEKFKKFADKYGASTQWVPATFICDDYIVGYGSDETTGKQIEDKVRNCIEHGCTDLNQSEQCAEDEGHVVQVPFLGEINLHEAGLPMLTVVLGFLDGFNPCAIWVLCFLLTLLVYAKSRKKIVIVGGIFVAASGLIYFLFMAAWLNFFLMVGLVQWLRITIGAIAVVAGLINVKDFFFFKKGVSLTIPDKLKPKLYKKMRGLVNLDNTTAVVIGTIVLAFTANSFELVCTFGFPAIYTRALTLHNLPVVTYYLYLLLYNIVYVIPLAVIVGIFAWTMGSYKLTDKHGKILKITGGLLMILLGAVLLFRPELLLFG